MSLNSPKKKILIIEDEATQRILAKEFLEAAGYMVRSSEDGKHGLNMAKRTQPDLIILDLLLPSLDGYTLCTSLKNSEQTAHIPIILVTASKEDDVIKRGLEVGADDFVTKPVDWQFLADRVNFVLTQCEKKKAVEAQLAEIHVEGDEAEDFDREEIALEFESLQQDIDFANTRSVETEEQHSREIRKLQAGANAALDSAQRAAANELADAQAQHTGEEKRLNDEFRVAAEEQERRFAQQLKSLEELHSLECSELRASAKEALEVACQTATEELAAAQSQHSSQIYRLRGEFDVVSSEKEQRFERQLEVLEDQLSRTSEEFNERSRAMWSIVGNSCDHHGEILSGSIGLGAKGLEISSDQRCAKLVKQAEYLARSMERLKKLSVLMMETSEPSGGVFEVNEFIENHAERLKQIAEQSQVSVNVDRHSSALDARADCNRMRYAMTLLSINALKSTPVEGAITVGAALDDNGDIRVSVSDTGTGMSQDERDGWMNCLDKASPNPGGRNRAFDLHIPIVAALVRQQGGQLEIQSEEGKGTSYCLVLPGRVDNAGWEEPPVSLQSDRVA